MSTVVPDVEKEGEKGNISSQVQLCLLLSR